MDGSNSFYQDELTKSLLNKCSIYSLGSDLDLENIDYATRLELIEFESIRRTGFYLIKHGTYVTLNREVINNQQLSGGNLKDFLLIPVDYSQFSVDGQALSIYDIGEIPSEEISTLQRYIKADNCNVTTVELLLDEVINSLYQWNLSTLIDPRSWDKMNGHRYISEWFKNRISSLKLQSGNISTLLELKDLGDDITNIDTLLFEACSVAMPNIFYYLDEEKLWKKPQIIIWPKCDLIGNFKLSSILFSPSNPHQFKIADVTSICSGNLFFDWFTLELDILLNSINLNSYNGWKQFVDLSRNLTKSVDIPKENPTEGVQASVIWRWIYRIRKKVSELVLAVTQKTHLETDLNETIWVGSILAALSAISNSSTYSSNQKKAALFYCVNALIQLLPHNKNFEPELYIKNPAKIIAVEPNKRNPTTGLFTDYINWVVQEGGATGHDFGDLENWFVNVEAKESSIAYKPRLQKKKSDWFSPSLEQQTGESIKPETRRALKGIFDIQNLVSEKYRVVILGEPGSGKTTLIEKLFLEYAKEILNQDTPIPVIIRLSAFKGDLTFKNFVIKQLGILGEFYDQIKDRLLLLCDALNEMPFVSYSEDKRNLIEELRIFLENEAKSWILSCRIRDYVTQKLSRVGGNVVRIEIQPLDPFQIKQIIQKRLQIRPDIAKGLWNELCGGSQFSSNEVLSIWKKFFFHNDQDRFWDLQSATTALGLTAAPSYITERELLLWRRMHERNLIRLCRNPYMLKLISRVYVKSIQKGTQMPNSQGQIFHEVVSDLINLEKEFFIESGKAWPDDQESRVINCLRILAFIMQTRTQTRQTETEISLTEAVSELKSNGINEPEKLISICKEAQIISGDDRSLHFSHQMMQEYFASVTIVEKMQEGPANIIWDQKEWWMKTNLDEMAVILTGWHQDWQEIVSWIAEINPELAAECLIRNDRSIEDLSSDTLTLIIDNIKKKIDYAVNKVEKAAAFRSLGWFSDQRAGVGVIPKNGVPNIAWSEPIINGPFWMGGDEEALNHWEGIEVDIPYTFYMARYPVTVVQYRCFIEDKGYSVQWRDCWSDLGWKWKEKGNRTEPYLWNNLYWTVPNNPVVGITWHEAYAFANWLNIKLHEFHLLPDNNLTVRLPLEAEWEKSARGPNGLLFPWGNEFKPEIANIKMENENDIGRTSACGMFEENQSPYKVYDLSGNIWEWCISEWKQEYSIGETIHVNKDTARSSRGGSWNHSSIMSRSASRFWYRPSVAASTWGVRVCASIKLDVEK